MTGVTHRLLRANSGGGRVVEGGGARLGEWRLQVKVHRLRRERHWPRGELRVHGLWETLGAHVEVLLGGHWVVVNGRGHWPHGRLHVVLGREPGGPLLPRGALKVRVSTLMGYIGYVIPVIGAFKPHGAHLVWRDFETQSPLLLLEAHWSRSRGHVVVKASWWFKVLHPFKVSRPLTHKPHLGLLDHGTIKPPGALRVGVKIKPPHPFSASHWTVRHVGGVWAIKPFWYVVMWWSAAIEPAGPLGVRPFELRRVIVPAGRVGSGGGYVFRAVIPGRRVPCFVRRGVSRRVALLSDRRQWSNTRRGLEGGGRRGIRFEGPFIRVLTVGALKARDRAHLSQVLLV